MEAQTITERKGYQGTTAYGTPPATWYLGNDGTRYYVRLKFVASANFSKVSFTFDFKSSSGDVMKTAPCYVGITTTDSSTHPAADSAAFTMGSTLGATVVFEKALSANTTYYLWLWCGVSSWDVVWAVNSQFTTSISCEMGGQVHVDDGTALEAYLVYIDDGEAFGQYMPYIDNGEAWEPCS